MILKVPFPLQKEIDKYFNLRIGGKSVACPYYLNKKVAVGNLRVMSGKGSAREIEHETKVWAKVKGFDLKKATTDEIREFMIDSKIGIDCSGFVVHILNNYLKQRNKRSLIRYLNFSNNDIISEIRRLLRPVENISANALSSELNTYKIKNLNNMRPGDLIRAKGKQRNAHHVAIVTEVELEIPCDVDGNSRTLMEYRKERNEIANLPGCSVHPQAKIKRFTYVNSHRYYKAQNGMRYGEVIITNPDKELKDQKWTDTFEGRNYFLEDLKVKYEDNGIRRLKFIDALGFYCEVEW